MSEALITSSPPPLTGVYLLNLNLTPMDGLLVVCEIAREGCHARICETLVACLGVFVVA